MALQGSVATTTGSAGANASYSVAVQVKVKQAAIPMGMTRIFDVLDKAIVDKVKA